MTTLVKTRKNFDPSKPVGTYRIAIYSSRLSQWTDVDVPAQPNDAGEITYRNFNYKTSAGIEIKFKADIEADAKKVSDSEVYVIINRAKVKVPELGERLALDADLNERAKDLLPLLRKHEKMHMYCCDHCDQEIDYKIEAGDRVESMVCEGCKIARYCDEKCQRAAWPGHKPVCKMFKADPGNKAKVFHIKRTCKKLTDTFEEWKPLILKVINTCGSKSFIKIDFSELKDGWKPADVA